MNENERFDIIRVKKKKIMIRNLFKKKKKLPWKLIKKRYRKSKIITSLYHLGCSCLSKEKNNKKNHEEN